MGWLIGTCLMQSCCYYDKMQTYPVCYGIARVSGVRAWARVPPSPAPLASGGLGNVRTPEARVGVIEVWRQ